MILKDVLRSVIKLQGKELDKIDFGIERNVLKNIDTKLPLVIILSGIRRCGKSTVLKQIIKNTDNFYYFNFEDQRVFGFETGDFEKLDEVFHEEFGECDIYFFDEIQNVEGWERFVRRMQDSGKRFVITGSNASLLSKELGTKLTGRHITHELFPFSYTEMLRLMSKKRSLLSFESYMKTGGFPEYLKFNKTEILQELLNDIVMRDIVSRYNIRETKTIKEIAIYILTNVGKEFSYTNIAKHFKLGSTNTAISYISYFEDSYLIFTIPKFDCSYKKQVIGPKKAYSIDTGLSNANSASFSDDKGRMLENIVFLDLRRKYKNIFYFKDKGECDFVIMDKGKLTMAIQVCYELTDDNKEREIGDLREAMKKLKIKKGIIITLNQEDELDEIEVKAAWKWLS